LLLFAAISAVGLDAPQPPLVIRGLCTIESDGEVWRVTLDVGNGSKSPVTDINVSFMPSQGSPWILQTLAPGEWKSETFPLNSGRLKSLIAFARYSKEGVASSIAVPVELPDMSRNQPPAWVMNIVPVVTGALIGLLGVFVTSLFNMRKERLAAMLQWNRFLVEHYDSQYREFLSKCSATVDAAALHGHLDQLDNSALVPDSIRARIRKGIEKVRSSPVNDKHAARETMLYDVRASLLEPFGRKSRE
jgi:hypothetical protein